MSNLSDDLTPTQTETLLFIIEFMKRNGYAPAIRNISDHFNISPNAAVQRLDYLVDKSYIRRAYNITRGITLLEKCKICTDLHTLGEINLLPSE